jgi:hypothetical protein
LRETSLICSRGFNEEHIGHCRRAGRTYRRPTEDSAHLRWPYSQRTALQSCLPLGSAEVTHPFHPLRGQRFVVLKLRTVSGVATLSVRHPDLGSFAIPREWTDWSSFDATALSQDTSLIIDAFGLVNLAMVVESLTRDSKRA